MKKYRLPFAFGLLLTAITSALAIVNPKISGSIVDDVIKAGNHDLLPKLIIVMLAVTLFRGVVRFLYQLIFEYCSQGMLYDMRDAVYRKFLHEDFSFYNRKRTGDLMSRQTGDLNAVRHFVSFAVYMTFEGILLLLFAIIMIFTIDWKLALCMLTVMPFTIINTYFQSKNVKPKFMNIRQRFSSLNAFVQENVSGNRVVKAFAKEDFEIEKFNLENDEYRAAELDASNVWKKHLPIFEVLSYTLNVMLMVYGGYLAIHGDITTGDLITVSGYLWMLTNPIRMLGWRVNDIHNFTTSIEKIYGTYAEEPNVKPPIEGVRKSKLQGAVEFKNVCYHPSDARGDIVTDISFTVKPGQMVGIIGSTGSGKSTIMNMLCRFYDCTSGEVLVDGINVHDMDLYNLRSNIGMAMQDVFLFSDTIEGNIAYAKPDCSFEEVRQAAIKADANHFISELPEGYDTIVGERGVGLSGGQKQRISLARALLKDPPILILDDTTSAVDMETESYIQQQLKTFETDSTIFIIAYRISSIKDADLILVMDQGRIIESGTHGELLSRGGYYAKAFRNQYGEIPEELIGGETDGTK